MSTSETLIFQRSVPGKCDLDNTDTLQFCVGLEREAGIPSVPRRWCQSAVAPVQVMESVLMKRQIHGPPLPF